MKPLGLSIIVSGICHSFWTQCLSPRLTASFNSDLSSQRPPHLQRKPKVQHSLPKLTDTSHTESFTSKFSCLSDPRLCPRSPDYRTTFIFIGEGCCCWGANALENRRRDREGKTPRHHSAKACSDVLGDRLGAALMAKRMYYPGKLFCQHLQD